MIYETVYLIAYRLIVALFAAVVFAMMLRAKETKTQVAAGMTLIPLLLRALGGK